MPIIFVMKGKCLFKDILRSAFKNPPGLKQILIYRFKPMTPLLKMYEESTKVHCTINPGPEIIKFFALNSTEHEISTAH